MQTSDSDTNHLLLQTQKWCGHEFLYRFHAFWFTKTYLQTTQKVVESFKPLPRDVILASFPKTGTTWLKSLLHSVVHRSPTHQDSLLFNHPQELVPSLETNLYIKETTEASAAAGTKIPESDRRILATHIPYQILGDVLNSCECKIIYVTRNPKDTLVSLWHFLQKSKSLEDDPWELEAAVDQFCGGVVPFGPYYDHVLAYREESKRRPHKVLFLTYEGLKEDPMNHVRKIGEFLGRPFGNGEELQVERIVKVCSFEVLSNREVNRSSELPVSGFPLPYSSFFRKGEVGDHNNLLDDEMIQKIDDITREKFHGNGFEYGI